MNKDLIDSILENAEYDAQSVVEQSEYAISSAHEVLVSAKEANCKAIDARDRIIHARQELENEDG